MARKFFRAETAKDHEPDLDRGHQGLDDAAAALHSGRLYLLRRHHPERLHSRSAQLLDSLRLDDEQNRPDGLLPDSL